uniref:Uncharacterized protein n=1 Tax=Glossina pallidipes TaxID=7398 RepID=A0A1B0A662_GLOPL
MARIYIAAPIVSTRNHYLMMPWVVLGIMIAIGLLVSVIYTAVVFFIDGFVLTGVLWLYYYYYYFIINFAKGRYNITLAFHVLRPISRTILTYCWCVVYSEFTILSEENERGRYNKQPYRR